MKPSQLGVFWVLGLFLGFLNPLQAQVDLNDRLEKAVKEAARKVSPSVVQIVTQGGADLVVNTPKGPIIRQTPRTTTGVIISSDGYIISSSFNFANNPTNILVSVPGVAEALVAKRLGDDKSKLLTLLKVEKTGLPVPAIVPTKELLEGQWTIAMGRTLDLRRDGPPSLSVGIISALNRVWGRAIQVDAKVSPVNYGGPIIDIQGRVQGILVPLAGKGDDETAGFEWYDSGIGFAIPIEDVLAVVPRLKEGKELRKGLLGIRLKSGDIYGATPEIGEITKDSAADKAGLKVGDIVTAVDGQPVTRMAQILQILGRKYAGDKIAIKYKRGDKELEANDVVLIGDLVQYVHPFLGILPMRDDPKLGVEVRYVIPKSPADRAGIKAGDRIVKYGLDKTVVGFSGQKQGRSELFDFLNKRTPGTEMVLEVNREGGKSETLKVTLENLTQDLPIPDKVPAESSKKGALKTLEKGQQPKLIPPIKKGPKDSEIPQEKKPIAKEAPPKEEVIKNKDADKEAKTGFVKMSTGAGGANKYWLYVPRNYDPQVAHGLVVWFHLPGKTKDEDHDEIIDEWAIFCRENNLILMGPISESESGWLPSESDQVVEAIQDAMTHYTIDHHRVVAHGMGVGGQMALYLGLNHREVIRGAASVGAVVPTITDNINTQRLSFFLAAGELDPLAKTIAADKAKLIDKKFPAVFRSMNNRGREYLDAASLQELVRWIDALDRQ